MPQPNRESDRLRRLRDQQLEARDPLKKQRRLDRSVAEKHRRARRAFSFSQVWSEIPHKWRGMLVGGFLGVALIAILPLFVGSPWGLIGGVVGMMFFVAFGFLYGRAQDTKDEIKDLIP